MSELIGITNLDTLDEETLFASTRDTQMEPVVITLGYPTAYHERGALLGKRTADSKYYDYNTAASDGTETFAGILAEDLPSLGEDQKCHMYVSGDINRAACVSISTIPTGLALSNNINFVDEV